MISADSALSGSFDYGEVARSVLIAIVASYAALDLVERGTPARGWIRLAWLSGGAIAMGFGIWAMHFKGMLAFLLIEDSKFMRIAVQRALAGAGYAVHTARNGEAGLRAAREILPDLVVLDLVLPTISGLDVIKALKRDATTKSIPVVVLAAFSESTKEEALNEGATAFVEKSDKLLENDSAVLIQTIAQVVDTAKPSKG